LKKIKRVKITDSFVPIDTSIIEIGHVIKFDCYVKRYNDFVIIIPSGTKIGDNEIKLLTNTQQHYINSKHNSEYKELLGNHTSEVSNSKNIASIDIGSHCKEIKGFVSNSTLSIEKKVQIIYDSGIAIMGEFFNNKITDFNKTCINDIIEIYILLLKNDSSTFKTMLNYMSHLDRHDIHSMNVTVLSLGLASHLNYTIIHLKDLGLASFLHDIGKKEIVQYIFEKSDPLTKAEYNLVKMHSTYSKLLAVSMGVKDNVLDAILHHHEYLDGTGYPDAKKGQQISGFSQIITVCDMFDAMTSERSFHDKKSVFETLNIMKNEFKDKLNVRYIDDLIKLLAKSFRT